MRKLATTTLLAATTLLTACTPHQVKTWFQHVYDTKVDDNTALYVSQILKPQTCTQAIDLVWPKESRAWAKKIAQRESGNNPAAQNPTSSAAGCLQLLRLHAWRFDAVGCSWAQRYDALCNVRAALHLYRENGRTPWRLTDY